MVSFGAGGGKGKTLPEDQEFVCVCSLAGPFCTDEVEYKVVIVRLTLVIFVIPKTELLLLFLSCAATDRASNIHPFDTNNRLARQTTAALLTQLLVSVPELPATLIPRTTPRNYSTLPQSQSWALVQRTSVDGLILTSLHHSHRDQRMRQSSFTGMFTLRIRLAA